MQQRVVNCNKLGDNFEKCVILFLEGSYSRLIYNLKQVNH